MVGSVVSASPRAMTPLAQSSSGVCPGDPGGQTWRRDSPQPCVCLSVQSLTMPCPVAPLRGVWRRSGSASDSVGSDPSSGRAAGSRRACHPPALRLGPL